MTEQKVTLILSTSEAAQAANALHWYTKMLERQKNGMMPEMIAPTNDEIYRANKLHADIVREIDKIFRPYRGPTVDNVMDTK